MSPLSNLTPVEIAALPFGKRCRYGVADRVTRLLLVSSDSMAYAKGWIKRAENVRYQFVIKP
jgi:hypothetical protein